MLYFANETCAGVYSIICASCSIVFYFIKIEFRSLGPMVLFQMVKTGN